MKDYAGKLSDVEQMDKTVKLAGRDEMRTHFDPTVHPKPHKMADEPICDTCGEPVDLMDMDEPVRFDRLNPFD